MKPHIPDSQLKVIFRPVWWEVLLVCGTSSVLAWCFGQLIWHN